MFSNWSLVEKCGAIAVACAAWNLLGDLYLMDFYTAHLSPDRFGMIREEMQSGYLFNFFNSQGAWWVFVAQSGGWMYPIWAVVTAVPIYIGLQPADGHHHNYHDWSIITPCMLLAYGLCVVGGGLHNSAAFLTVLPTIYHDPAAAEKYSDLIGKDQFSNFLDIAQGRIIQHILVGCLPGIISCNVAGLWIGLLVHFRPTRFPKSYNFFNPLVTSFWVQIVGILLPEPAGSYFAGCLGTWGMLVLNIGTTYMLQDAADAGVEYSVIS
ncbi:hypothetical protein ACA910_003036 [Epithemia clementina (nom. ined.)]